MLVDVREVHPEPQALDVGKLQVAVWDVPPVPVPGGQPVRSVSVVVRRSHRDTSNARARIEKEVHRAALIGHLELSKIFFELRKGALPIGASNATGACVVERRYTDAFAKARQHRAKSTSQTCIPDTSGHRRESGPPSIIPATWINEPSHQLDSVCVATATTSETAIAVREITVRLLRELSRWRRLAT